MHDDLQDMLQRPFKQNASNLNEAFLFLLDYLRTPNWRGEKKVTYCCTFGTLRTKRKESQDGFRQLWKHMDFHFQVTNSKHNYNSKS